MTYRATLCGMVIGRRGRPLNLFLKKNGYLHFSMSSGYGNPNQTLVHRFVWGYFNGPIPEGYTIDHINGDKVDNRITNLDLLPPGENARKGNRLLSDEDILTLKSLLNVRSGKELSAMFGVSPQTVSNIKTGFRWGHLKLTDRNNKPLTITTH